MATVFYYMVIARKNNVILCDWIDHFFGSRENRKAFRKKYDGVIEQKPQGTTSDHFTQPLSATQIKLSTRTLVKK